MANTKTAPNTKTVEPISVEKPGANLTEIKKNAVTAFVANLSPEEKDLLLSLIDHNELVGELQRRLGKAKFQLDVIKGIVEEL